MTTMEILAKPKPTTNISFQLVDTQTISKVRTLNTILFPVRYSNSFYKSLLQPGQFAQLAFHQDHCVGTVACRKQPLGYATNPKGIVSASQIARLNNSNAGLANKTEKGSCEIYMMTLGVLAPYRRLGVGRMLLNNALKHAAQDPTIKRMVLHVQINNDDALRFYQNNGFVNVDMVERYYKNIDPPHDAYLLEYQFQR